MSRSRCGRRRRNRAPSRVEHVFVVVLMRGTSELAHRRLVGNVTTAPSAPASSIASTLLRRRARDHAQVGCCSLTLRHVLDVGAARGMPHVTELARTPHRALGAAADPDLGQRRGGAAPPSRHGTTSSAPWKECSPRQSARMTRIASSRAAPAALERDAHELELVPVPAHADAERDAAAGELLQRRHLLREVERVVQRQDHDRGAEPDALGPAGDPAERDERVVDAAVRIDAFGADDDVLRRPHRVEAELLGGLGGAADPVGRRARP